MVSKIGQRKFLLKHGYFESELDKMSPSEAKRIIASIEKIEHPQGQRKIYSEKEINAIKEFVEWLKAKVNKELQFALDNHSYVLKAIEEFRSDDTECEARWDGKCDAYSEIIDLLCEETLEKFLEERNGKQD